MTTDVNLEPCPFCGSRNVLPAMIGYQRRVYCKQCGANGPGFHPDGSGQSPEVRAWNTRHQPQEREAVWGLEWKRHCDACDGEAPEYGKSDCGECGGEGWSWSDDDVPLAECPIGLFRHGDTLALKTEYGNNEGRIDAYIVSSGEFFWGDAPQTIVSQRASLVRPITEIDAITTPAPAQEREADLRSKLRCVISHATGGETDDPDLSLNEICVRISAFRNKLYQAGKDAALTTPAPKSSGGKA